MPNPVEAAIAVAIARGLDAHTPQADCSRQFLTFYKAQVQQFQSLGVPKDRVGTVDSSQGQEWDDVILSVGKYAGMGFCARRLSCERRAQLVC